MFCYESIESLLYHEKNRSTLIDMFALKEKNTEHINIILYDKNHYLISLINTNGMAGIFVIPPKNVEECVECGFYMDI